MKLYIGLKHTALSSDIHQALSYVILSGKKYGTRKTVHTRFLMLLWDCDTSESQTPNVFSFSATLKIVTILPGSKPGTL
jgi:hypothetical protein